MRVTTGTASSSSSSSSATATSSSSSTGGSTAFIELTDTSSLLVGASFAEADVTSLRVGQAATVTLPSSSRSLAARITAIDASGTTSSSVVTYGVTLRLTGAPKGLRLGQTADVTVTTGSKANVLVLPSAALSGSGTSRSVSVLRNGQAVRTVVRVGLDGDSTVEIASGLAEGGTSALDVAVTFAIAIGFVAFFGLGGTRAFAARPAILKVPRFSESPLLPAVIVCFALAALATEIGLAAIIGAFIAGMMVAETKEAAPVEHEVAPLYAFFPPFFFASIGIQVQLDALRGWGTLGLLLVLLVVAAATKLVGAGIGALRLARREALLVGVGMIPRGEVGLIVAGLGLSLGWRYFGPVQAEYKNSSPTLNGNVYDYAARIGAQSYADAELRAAARVG